LPEEYCSIQFVSGQAFIRTRRLFLPEQSGLAPFLKSILIMKKFLTLLLLSALACLPYSCHKVSNTNSEVRSLRHKTAEYDGRMAREWMQMGYNTIKDNFLFGPHAGRIYGYLGLTIWESVYNGIPGAKSMAGQINDYPEAATLDTNKEYDWGIVLCNAMAVVFPELIDNESAAQRSQVSVLADLQESEMMNTPGVTELVRENSKEFGNRVGQKIVQRIKNDGRRIISNIVPVIPTRDADHKWYWDGTTYHQQPVEPMWSTLRTFVTDPPLSYSEAIGSDFYNEAKEIYKYYPLSDERKKMVYHWDDGPGRTSSPAGHWVSIAMQLLEKDNQNLAQSAKAFCLIGFTAADAFSSSWYMKYKYFLERPGTYIKEVIDSKWEAAIGTPPYPEYTSASSTVAGAMAVTMVSIFGDVPFLDKTYVGSPLYTPSGGPFLLPERQFSSITQAAVEQKASRILGGVSFRRGAEQGYTAGNCVGNTIMARIHFGF
jgi:hypothetical protein